MHRRSSFLHFVFLAAAISALYVLTCGSLRAQVDFGSILGTIKDQTGAVIPGAKVSLRNEGTALTVLTTTGPDGSYNFSPVKLGTYEISAEAAGFSRAVQSHLTLNIDQKLVVDLSLTPGVVTQTVEVTAAPPALQTQDASVGQVVNARSVNDLPLNGRNFTFLAQVVAGVNTPQSDTRGNAASGAFTANGLRPSQNNYLLDGIDNNSDNVDFLNGTNFVVLPPPDALGEFKVQTSDFSAQYGRAGGAILNATMKSGTNQIHGNLWEFARNDKFDAADFFEDEGNLQKGEFRQNQFGFTIGGPVVIPHVFDGRNKLFFFGDAEWLRRRQGSVFTNTVPTPLEVSSGFTNLADNLLGSTSPSCLSSLNCTYTDDLGRQLPYGIITDPATTRPVTAGTVDPVTGLTATDSGWVEDPFYTGGPVGNMKNFINLGTLCPTNSGCMLNQIPVGRIDPNALKLLSLYPAATAVNSNQDVNPLITSNQASNPVLIENRVAFDTRMDWNKSDKDQIFGTFSYVRDPQFIPAPFKGIADGGAFQQGLQSANSFLTSISYTHIFSPSLVNEARLGEDRLVASRYGPVATQLTDLPAQYGIPGIAQVQDNGGLPAIGIGGLNTLGSNAYLPSDEITQTTQLTENLTKIYGKHSFKMGMEFQHIKFSTLQPAWSHGQIDFDGTWSGDGLSQLLLTPATSSVPGGIDYVGGSDGMFVSNFSPTDDGHNYWAAYFQDDWKVSSKLTVNLGLRWEHFGQVVENHGRQANFLPNQVPGATAQYLEPDNGKNQAIDVNPAFPALLAQDGIALKYTHLLPLATVPDTNFGPRIGLAYQITPKLVLRTGFGLFYNAFENVGYGPNIGENYPFQYTLSYFNTNAGTPVSLTNFNGSTCTPAATLETTFACIPLNVSLVGPEGLGLEGRQYNYITPYTLGWNFTLQYQLSPNTALTVAYVGNGSRHDNALVGANDPTIIDLNPISPSNRYETENGVRINSTDPFPDFANGGSYQESAGTSNYAGLQTTVERRFSNGFNFLGNYTWSHCRDDAGDPLNGTGADTWRAPWVPGLGINYDYLNCDYNIFDVGHLSGGYVLPFGKGNHFLPGATGILNQMVKGWQAVWNLTLEGGQPETIGCVSGTNNTIGCTAMINKSVSPNGTRGVDQFWNPNYFTQPCPAAGFSQPAKCVPLSGLPAISAPASNPYQPVPCTPLSSCKGLLGGADTQVSGPGIGRLDFSMFKNFQLNERSRLEFRAEFFNITNHPTFNAPGFGGNGVTAVSGSTTYTNTNFGKIGSTRFPFQDPRQIQFALKLYF
jgi:hypothetical protein